MSTYTIQMSNYTIPTSTYIIQISYYTIQIGNYTMQKRKDKILQRLTCHTFLRIYGIFVYRLVLYTRVCSKYVRFFGYVTLAYRSSKQAN